MTTALSTNDILITNIVEAYDALVTTNIFVEKFDITNLLATTETLFDSFTENERTTIDLFCEDKYDDRSTDVQALSDLVLTSLYVIWHVRRLPALTTFARVSEEVRDLSNSIFDIRSYIGDN
jgi:hypothetical protein